MLECHLVVTPDLIFYSTPEQVCCAFCVKVCVCLRCRLWGIPSVTWSVTVAHRGGALWPRALIHNAVDDDANSNIPPVNHKKRRGNPSERARRRRIEVSLCSKQKGWTRINICVCVLPRPFHLLPGCISGWLRIKRLNDGGIFLCEQHQVQRDTHQRSWHALSLFTCASLVYPVHFRSESIFSIHSRITIAPVLPLDYWWRGIASTNNK